MPPRRHRARPLVLAVIALASACRGFLGDPGTGGIGSTSDTADSSTTTQATGPTVCWQATGVPDTVLEDQTGGLAGAIDAPFLVSACGTAELERFQGTFDRGTLRVTQDQPTVTIQIDDDALRERLEGSWNDGATSAQLLLESHPSSPGAVRYAIGQLIGLDATLAIGPIDGLNETGLGLDDDGFPVLEPFGVDAQITLSLVDPDDPTVVTDAITDAGQAALTLTEISGGER